MPSNIMPREQCLEKALRKYLLNNLSNLLLYYRLSLSLL